MNVSSMTSFADMPLAPPPPNQAPDFDAPAPAGTVAWVLDILSLTLALVMVVIRLYVKRFFSKQNICWDDGLCVVAMCIAILHTGVALHTLQYGLGKYMYNIRIISVTDKKILAMTSLHIIATINMLMVRLAVLTLYHRLFNVCHLSRKLIHVGFVVSTALAIAEAGVAIGRMSKCTTALANVTVSFCSKQNASISIMIFALAACIIDVFIYSIAMSRLRLLHVYRNKKMQLIAVFAMGFLAVIFSFVNFVFSAVVLNTPEQMWQALWFSIFKVLEANIALACTSAIFVPAFWESTFPKLQDSTIKMSDENAVHGHPKIPNSDEALVHGHEFGINLPQLAPTRTSLSW